MNLIEFSEKLTPEDKQLVFDNFVRYILGKTPLEEMVLQRTAKISTLGKTDDEIKKEISHVLDIPIKKIANQNIIQTLQNISIKHKKVEFLIQPYKDFLLMKKARDDKFEELRDLGNFLISLNSNHNITIPEKSLEYPDFIITHDNKRIGVEHTRLMNNQTKNLIRKLLHILKKAEQIILQRNNFATQIVNISINYGKIIVGNKNLINQNFTKKDKETIAEVIANYIIGLLNNNCIIKPEFIDEVTISNGSIHPLNIILSEKYIEKIEFKDLFSSRIISKEKKYESYFKSEPIDELWLFIVINGVSAASSYLITPDTFKEKMDSQFDKIYLFNNFSHEIFLIHERN